MASADGKTIAGRTTKTDSIGGAVGATSTTAAFDFTIGTVGFQDLK